MTAPKAATPYLLGRFARAMQEPADANPFNEVARVTKAGTPIYREPEARTEWAKGWRDENDALHIARNGPLPRLGDFVKRKSRR